MSQFLTSEPMVNWMGIDDHAWALTAGLLAFYSDLSNTVNEEWCSAYLHSLKRSPNGKNFPTGVVDNVEISWNGRYMFDLFGWTGQGETSGSKLTRESVGDWVGDAARMSKDHYDLKNLRRLKGNEVSIRVQGILSTVFFRKNTHYVREEHLHVIMLAHAGVPINWATLFNKSVNEEFRHFLDKSTAPTVVGPFLTNYIHRTREYFAVCGVTPPMVHVKDLWTHVEGIQAANEELPRLDEPVSGGTSQTWEDRRVDLEIRLSDMVLAVQEFVKISSTREADCTTAHEYVVDTDARIESLEKDLFEERNQLHMLQAELLSVRSKLAMSDRTLELVIGKLDGKVIVAKQDHAEQQVEVFSRTAAAKRRTVEKQLSEANLTIEVLTAAVKTAEYEKTASHMERDAAKADLATAQKRLHALELDRLTDIESWSSKYQVSQNLYATSECRVAQLTASQTELRRQRDELAAQFDLQGNENRTV